MARDEDVLHAAKGPDQPIEHDVRVRLLPAPAVICIQRHMVRQQRVGTFLQPLRVVLISPGSREPLDNLALGADELPAADHAFHEDLAEIRVFAVRTGEDVWPLEQEREPEVVARLVEIRPEKISRRTEHLCNEPRATASDPANRHRRLAATQKIGLGIVHATASIND